MLNWVPGSAASRGRTRVMNTFAGSRDPSGLSRTNTVAEVKSCPPAKVTTVSTAGSRRRMSCTAFILCLRTSKGTPGSARIFPRMSPLSCSGNNPFGTAMSSMTFSTTAPTSTSMSTPGRRSANASDFAYVRCITSMI